MAKLVFATPTSNRTSVAADDNSSRPKTPPAMAVANLWRDLALHTWDNELIRYILEPARYANITLYRDDKFVVVRDTYPKGKYHFLVIPADRRIDRPADLTTADLDMLREMGRVANKIITAYVDKRVAANMTFKIGFHSVPSCRQLHCHVVSTDFCGTHMKTKKNWNAFNTQFFLPLVDTIDELESSGSLAVDEAQGDTLLAKDLVYQGRPFRNILQLKQVLGQQFSV